jgi:protein-S-isoprenylcysteine O-methyltransferase Ste14
MIVFHLLILVSWLTLIAYWAVEAGRVKSNVRGKWQWRREIGLRLAILVLVVLALRVPGVRHQLQTVRRYVANTNLTAGYCGAALCACGVILAIWARACLGRNWGIPMAEKASPDLVTAGPYSHIRHPIYAGIILAILGSAIGQSILWVIPLVIVVPYFVFSARREEKLMSEKFPRQYPAYMDRSNMLIPFLF